MWVEEEVLAYCPKCKAVTPHKLITYYVELDVVSSGPVAEKWVVFVCENCGYREERMVGVEED